MAGVRQLPLTLKRRAAFESTSISLAAIIHVYDNDAAGLIEAEKKRAILPTHKRYRPFREPFSAFTSPRPLAASPSNARIIRCASVRSM
jgi:hypothetical protein